MKSDFFIAKEFGKTPSARIEEEGKLSGRELRNILIPMIRQSLSDGQRFTIDMDGTAGYGTSFLEEVFGGLIRIAGFSLHDLEMCLIIKSNEDPDLVDEVWEDIRDAEEEKQRKG